MSNIEPEVKDFLQRILWSIGAGFVWMVSNMTPGIFGGWLFFENKPAPGNYIFYIWMVASFAMLLWFYFRTWRKRLR